MEWYHNEFFYKTYGEVSSRYAELGMNPDNIPFDMVRHCCVIFEIAGLVIPENIPIHPDMTPQIMAGFLYRTIQLWISTSGRIITECARYDRFDEVAQLLTQNCKYAHVVKQSPADGPSITLLGPALKLPNAFQLDFDKFIFVTDVIANNGFRNSIRYGICIDYFGILDSEVDDYKKLCIEMIKPCY